MNKYNLEENSKLRRFLRIAGPITLGIGVICAIIGFADFFIAFGNYAPTLFFMCFIGLPLAAIGGQMTAVGYASTIARYGASQTAPVAKDVANYMIDGTKESVAGFVSGIVGQRPSSEKTVKCPSCGEIANPGAVFCDHCGQTLAKICPNCQAHNDADARYCEKCGQAI